MIVLNLASEERSFALPAGTVVDTVLATTRFESPIDGVVRGDEGIVLRLAATG